MVLGMNPDFPPAHLWLGRTYQEIGRFDEALAAFRRVEDRIPDWPVAIAARGFVAGVAGRTAQALEALAALEELSARRFVTSYGSRSSMPDFGRDDAAFGWLNKAVDERSNWLVWLRLDPRWNSTAPRSTICAPREPRAISVVDQRLPPRLVPGRLPVRGQERWFGCRPPGSQQSERHDLNERRLSKTALCVVNGWDGREADITEVCPQGLFVTRGGPYPNFCIRGVSGPPYNRQRIAALAQSV